MQERMAEMQREYSIVEEAPWFGRTGLDEGLERELPRYLRREFGESIFDEGSLKAADLTYLGNFNEPDASVHYWGGKNPSMRTSRSRPMGNSSLPGETENHQLKVQFDPRILPRGL